MFVRGLRCQRHTRLNVGTLSTLAHFDRHVLSHQDAYTAKLAEFVAIPSVSTEVKSREECYRAADWLQREMQDLGVKVKRKTFLDCNLACKFFFSLFIIKKTKKKTKKNLIRLQGMSWGHTFWTLNNYASLLLY
eukprot:Lithocolla_globosa_v1_NODE_485_length_3924_cov_498.966658.p3 type:complete len:134 gc:universal NODE_485_length_3924_cov_498.966658:1451-1852(+)